MPKAKEKKVIIPSKRVAEAMVGYQPLMGDEQDIAIRDAFARLDKKLKLVDNKEFRALEAKGDTASMSSKMKEILRDEETIINWVHQRKFDF